MKPPMEPPITVSILTTPIDCKLSEDVLLRAGDVFTTSYSDEVITITGLLTADVPGDVRYAVQSAAEPKIGGDRLAPAWSFARSIASGELIRREPDVSERSETTG